MRIGYTDPDQAVTASVNEALDLPINGDAKWIAPPPDAYQPARDELTDIERRAAALSLSFLSGEGAKKNVTATATQIDQQGQDASLAGVAIALRDSLNRLWAIVDAMNGGTSRDTYFDVSTSFRGEMRDPQYLRLIVDTWKAGGLPIDAMLYALESGELPDDFNAEQAALDAVAEADAKAQAALEQAQQTGNAAGGTFGDQGAAA